MKDILHDLKESLLSPITLLGWVSASIITTVIGPFGTYDSVPLDQRFTFWTPILFIAIVSASAIQKTVFHLRPSWSVLKQTVFTCISFTLLYWLFTLLTINSIYAHLKLPNPLLGFLVIAAVTVSVFIMIHLISPETLKTSAKKASEDIPPPINPEISPEPEIASVPDQSAKSSQAFMRRLGPEAGTHLVRLAMRDHYIEVITDTGSKLMHMRFADALSEIAELNGGKIHRSHWVNFDQIESVVKDGAKIGFCMSDGAIVPIARSQKARLKKRGLI